MKKVFIMAMPLVLGITLFSTNINAKNAEVSREVFESDKIPFWMPDHTVIHYIDDVHFVVDGIVIDEKARNEIIAGIKDIQTFDESTVTHVPGNPEKGITVYYSENGELVSIRNEDGSSFDKMKKTHANNDKKTIAYANDEHQLTLFASWGNNNKLYRERGTGKIWGYGNASIFTDRCGNHNNDLKKGDCATKMNVDPCKNGAVVTVTVGSKTHNFIKNDVGALPNAVIDIWKDGIKYLGGTDSEIKNESFLKRCSMRHLEER